MEDEFLEAAECGRVMGLEVLLAKGVNINASNGRTALGWASHEGYVDCLRFLLAKGANVNAGSIPPLIDASVRCHPACVRALLEARADYTLQRAEDGRTALHSAVLAESWPCMEVGWHASIFV